MLQKNKIHCPCCDCKNGDFFTLKEIRRKILVNGFKLNYTVWTKHGEDDASDNQMDDEILFDNMDNSEDEGEDHDNADMMEMLNDVQVSLQTEKNDDERNNHDDTTYTC